MVYIIASIIIYLALVLFFWSLCAIKDRSSYKANESALPKEAETSFSDVLARRYSSADGV